MCVKQLLLLSNIPRIRASVLLPPFPPTLTIEAGGYLFLKHLFTAKWSPEDICEEIHGSPLDVACTSTRSAATWSGQVFLTSMSCSFWKEELHPGARQEESDGS